MDEVVSVSDLSPLAAGMTGATVAPFSCSAGCSGTGIADMDGRRHVISPAVRFQKKSKRKKEKRKKKKKVQDKTHTCGGRGKGKLCTVSGHRFPLGKSSGLSLCRCTGSKLTSKTPFSSGTAEATASRRRPTTTRACQRHNYWRPCGDHAASCRGCDSSHCRRRLGFAVFPETSETAIPGV